MTFEEEQRITALNAAQDARDMTPKHKCGHNVSLMYTPGDGKLEAAMAIDCDECYVKARHLPKDDEEMIEVMSDYDRELRDRERELERRGLWRECAIKASASFLTLDQPAQLADAVLAAYDAKFLGAFPPAPKPEKPPSMDPVDAILESFGGV